MADLSQILLTVAVVGGFTAILSFISHRQKQSSWKGELVDKYFSEGDDEGSGDKWTLVFKTETGKKVKADVFEKEYNEYKVGDKAEKKAGEYFPVKI